MSTLSDDRRALREWLLDMEALKPYADPGNPESQPFVHAFSAARRKALEFARRYAAALETRDQQTAPRERPDAQAS